jgi:phosphatidylinositol alpha-1,6-mannosyltransferase
MSLRVLWVTQDFPPDTGGIQTYSAQLVRALVELGHDVEVVAPQRPGAAEHDRTFAAPVRRIAAPRDAMPIAAALHVLAERRHHDVAVHAQWTTALGSLGARRRGRIGRIVVAAHGRELLWRPRVLALAHDRVRRAILGAADRVVAVSRYTRGLALAAGADPSRTCVVPNGSDVARLDRSVVRARAGELRASLGAARVLLTVARLVPHKGIDTVLRALPAVASEVPDVVYVVVGDGRDRARLEALAQELGVAARVRFVGSVSDDDAAAWMHACDAFALLSRERVPDVEGFGIVLLDAAACARAVVAGRTGGIPDAVLDGETGLLCHPTRADEVVAALTEVLRDPSRARVLGAAGRTRVEHELSWSHAGARLSRVLSSLFERRGAEVSHVHEDPRAPEPRTGA